MLDKAGLAQKYGAVTSHIRIAERPEDLHAVRIAVGGARLLLGIDRVVAASREAVSRLDKSASHAVVNGGPITTGDFTRAPDLEFPGAKLEGVVGAAARAMDVVDATRLATALVGDAVYTNLFLLGFAYQRGLVPLGAEAIERADRAQRGRGRGQPACLPLGPRRRARCQRGRRRSGRDRHPAAGAAGAGAGRADRAPRLRPPGLSEHGSREPLPRPG